jgi:hypothetical protein
MMSVPPGRKIRCISATVRPGSVKWMTRLMKAVSNVPSGKDVRWQSSTWNVTFAAFTCRFASSTMPREMSVARRRSDLRASTPV